MKTYYHLRGNSQLLIDLLPVSYLSTSPRPIPSPVHSINGLCSIYRKQAASNSADESTSFRLLLEFIMIRYQKIQQPIRFFLEVAPDGNLTLVKLPPGFRLWRAAIPGGTQVFLDWIYNNSILGYSKLCIFLENISDH